MLFVRPVERPPTHMQQRIAAPGPLVDLRTVEAAWVQALRERAAANWEAVRKQEALELSGPNTLTQAWSEFERYVTRAPVPAVEPFVERMLCSEPLVYKHNIFDNSFVFGSRVCDEAERATGAAVRAAVVEVD
jgi:hypothetical protein